jgi:hypothetical protein
MRMIFLAAAIVTTSETAFAGPPPATYVRTDDSDEWVTRSLRIPARPTRVLVVTEGAAPRHVSVPDLDLNARRPPTSVRDYPVAGAYRTLQAAADAARGGDVVAVLPGRYAGFVIRDKPGDGYIRFKAIGKPGQVTIDRATDRQPDWMIYLQAAHHVTIEGFDIVGSTGPGQEPRGPLAGIMIDGDFGRSGKMAHHVAVVGNFSHNHSKWGLHSTDTHTVLLQDNLFALSCQEHSAYVSDGSDDYVIRRNVFFGSRSGGLQCNIDPLSSFGELLKHQALRELGPDGRTREWALSLVARATELFGEGNFPDGRGVSFIIEENVVNGNGKRGGGSLNFAALQESLVQNNLLYGNFNHGIALWNDGTPYDKAYVVPGPRSASEVAGRESLPLWGCRSNRIRNNTVLMANPGRAALLMINGSWGNLVRNNVLVNDEPSSMEISGTSTLRLDSDYNVLNAVRFVGISIHSVAEQFPYPGATDMDPSLKTFAVRLDEAGHSTLGVTRARFAEEVVRYGEEPWVVIEGGWWRLNPARPDFRPRPKSPLLSGRGDPSAQAPRDLEGGRRTSSDIGALSKAAP